MTTLSNTIYRHYFDHWSQLSPEKQFHFASRLFLWTQDAEAKRKIAILRPAFTHNESAELAVRDIVAAAQASPVHGSKNAASLRRPYFERYPKLKTYVSVLFRLNFLLTIYGIDRRDLLFEFFKKDEVERLRDQLLHDPEALAILSTHAINFLYLYERTICENESGLSINSFLQIGKSAYDFTDKLHLQLFIYLYTHCIIGESKFYYRSIPVAHLEEYRSMIAELEQIIDEHFININLDNKFEFLACAKLVGVTSKLQGRIFVEAENSLSTEGNFLIDQHNNNPQLDNIDLEKSEHRNVLFILANHDFTPISQ